MSLELIVQDLSDAWILSSLYVDIYARTYVSMYVCIVKIRLSLPFPATCFTYRLFVILSV